MKKYLSLLLLMLFSMTTMFARPVDETSARTVALKFFSSNFDNKLGDNDLQLTYLGISTRGETCFYVYNVGTTGFVIVSADDRFRPIVGYSNEGSFATENPSPELMFYLNKIMEARTRRDAVLFENTEKEWESVMTSGKLLSRNGGRGVDYICTTKWNQDSPYNLYAPEANSGPGGHCYAGCVATAMSQVMKHWDHPLQGTGSKSYYCYGYGMQSANFGQTTYDWDNMPERLNGNASQTEIEAVALLMYHCGVAVEMNFTPTGSGANSWDVPYAIKHYFSYSNEAYIKGRDECSLIVWQNLLKEQFDLGWPVYYSGFSEDGGHAFVCDGYDDNDLFHFNWGWGGNSDGWFIIDEIDYANWAQAIFNFVPTNVYDYQPMQPENLSVTTSNDFDYSATLQWTNPSQNIHLNDLNAIDQIVVTRNGKIIYTEDDVTPGADMTFTDHYLPAMVTYGVYAIVQNAQGLANTEENILLGPTCTWTVEMSSSDAEGWKDGALSFVNEAGDQVAWVTLETTNATRPIQLPLGHIEIIWNSTNETIENIGFKIKNSLGVAKVSFEGAPSDLERGLFFIANNTCIEADEEESDGPTKLTIQNADSYASFSWDAPNHLNVINYHIYRDNSLYDIATDRTFTDNEEIDAFHSYYVTAFTENGESAASNIVNVSPESPCIIPTNLRFEMVTPVKAKIMWDAPESENVTGYILYRRIKGESFKRIKLLTNTYYTDNLSSHPDNRFEYAVVAYYRDNDCTSGYASTQDNPELNFIEVNKTIIPRYLDFIIHEGHVILQWENATMAESFNIYRDGQRIAHDITETHFIDYEANPQNTYYYSVTGQTAFVESSPSNVVYVDWTTGIDENKESQSVAIYPNPTEDKAFIEGEGLRQVRIYNMMGQAVQNYTVTGNQTVIDLSAYPMGCYFIETVTEHGCEINKILKIK